jgi:hypothetical protein
MSRRLIWTSKTKCEPHIGTGKELEAISRGSLETYERHYQPVQLYSVRNPPRVARLCYTLGCSPRDGQLGFQNAAIP